jgi:F-type H+-transporting ATPase subunit b
MKNLLSLLVWTLMAGVAAASGGGEPSLPQLEVDHYSSQIFWLLLSFGLLYILISKSALPVIHEVVEKRRHRIERDLEQAERLALQAKQSKEAFEEIYRLSLEQSKELIAKADMEIEAKHYVENSKLDAQIVSMMHKAEVEIEQRCEKMHQNLQTLSYDLVQVLLQEIAGKLGSENDINNIFARGN